MFFAINGRISTAPIEGGIEISQEQYSTALAGIAAGKLITIDGGFAVSDPPKPAPQPEPEPPTLDEVKTMLRNQVDAEAETTRLKFVTGGAGQAMTYQQKATEATACRADPVPDVANYPLIAAEVGITADTLTAVAQLVYDAHKRWRVIGAQIEALRLGAKAAINAAETIEEVEAAAVVAWPGSTSRLALASHPDSRGRITTQY